MAFEWDHPLLGEPCVSNYTFLLPSQEPPLGLPALPCSPLSCCSALPCSARSKFHFDFQRRLTFNNVPFLCYKLDILHVFLSHALCSLQGLLYPTPIYSEHLRCISKPHESRESIGWLGRPHRSSDTDCCEDNYKSPWGKGHVQRIKTTG